VSIPFLSPYTFGGRGGGEKKKKEKKGKKRGGERKAVWGVANWAQTGLNGNGTGKKGKKKMEGGYRGKHANFFPTKSEDEAMPGKKRGKKKKKKGKEGKEGGWRNRDQ